MGKPAARLTDMHTCPMVTPGTPPIPHVGGPISGPCVPPVLIGFLPAATVGDMCVCVGPPDTIAMGSPTVFIGGKMAARMGDPTMHGGVIVVGCPTVLIGESGSGGVGGGGGGGFTAPQPVEQSWWDQAVEQALKGEFYEGERTTVGTIAEIIAGLNPVADVRDFTGASKKMWNDPSWGNAGNVVLNAIGAFPVAGDAVKAIGKGAKATDVAKVADTAKASGVSKVAEASKGINITEEGLEHVVERHTTSGPPKFANKSKFFDGESLEDLISSSEKVEPVIQNNGNLQRTFDVGRDVGFDRNIGQNTSVMTVITKPNGELVTAFPGRP